MPRPMLYNPSQPEQKNLWGWKHAPWRSGVWGWNERYNVSKCYFYAFRHEMHYMFKYLLSVWLCQVFVHYFCSQTDNVEKQFTLFGHPLHRAVESWNSHHNLANLFSLELYPMCWPDLEFTVSQWGSWRNHQSTSNSHHDIFTLYTHAWFKFQTMVF